MRVTAIDDERSLGGPATAWGVLDGYDRPVAADVVKPDAARSGLL